MAINPTEVYEYNYNEEGKVGNATLETRFLKVVSG